MSADERPVSRAAKAVSILLALAFPARMAWIVFTVGENNLSNDYVARVPLVTAMLDGTCTLGTYVRNAWIGGGHSTVAVTPIYWASARFFAWDVRVELVVGLLIAGATLALIAATLSARTRWTLLPLLSLLLFSTTKVSSLTFGESTIQMGLAQLGLAIGAFGFARKGSRALALVAWLAAGGVLASWSWGGGVMAWPVFFGALAVRRVRSAGAWALLSAGAALGLAQYAWLLRPHGAGGSPGSTPWGAKAPLFLDLVGRPLANGIGHADPSIRAQVTGAFGLIALALVLVLLPAAVRSNPVSLLFAAWATLVAAEIALARTAVAPWYASPMAFFWVGLLVLLAGAPDPVRVGGILVVALLSVSVQFTWEDKSYYLPSRSPASAACLREWRTAPAACHARVFQWGEEGHDGELARLGEPLERLHLSVFSRGRKYLLQGDAALGRVAVATPAHAAFLSRDGRTPGDLNDFHRLDLVLATGAAVTWRVDLPTNLKSARFETRVRAAAGDPMLARGARVTVDGEAREARVLVPAGERAPLSLDLRPLAGRAVTLRIEAEEATGAASLILEAPRILLTVDADANATGR